jgi:serine/threonine-protein kinase
MAAPPPPAQNAAIELDSEDLVVEPEERSMSQTRRLGSNARAAMELEIKPIEAPPTGDLDISMLVQQAPQAEPSEAAEPEKPLAKPYVSGDVIAGKYKLKRIIGRGGMGAVWQAHNIPLDIDVAIKLIRRDRTAPEAAGRLLTEARAAARLMHPSIVRVFDFGETEQADPFIVMELLHGESLSAILRRKKRLTPAVAVQTLLPVASALVSAHNKGIVHRDLKPDNIIVVTDEGGALVPKIVDFGIAKLLSPDVDRQVTMAGEVLGSPDYMSPEQARGADNVGEATDVWAFSVVLYETVTGKRPFDGPNYNSLIAAILTNDPAPITAHGAGDSALAGIIEHGLAKDIAARWPRMKELGSALAAWALDKGIEDDLGGGSIRKQWLSGAMKRLFTVMPDDGELAATVQAAVAAQGGAPPAVALPARPQMPTIPPDAVAASRRRSRVALLAIMVGAMLGALCVAAILFRTRLLDLAAQPAASAAPSAEPTSVVTAAPPPPPTTASAEATASAAPAVPSASASAKRPPIKGPLKTKVAPQAPKNIRF